MLKNFEVATENDSEWIFNFGTHKIQVNESQTTYRHLASGNVLLLQVCRYVFTIDGVPYTAVAQITSEEYFLSRAQIQVVIAQAIGKQLIS